MKIGSEGDEQRVRVCAAARHSTDPDRLFLRAYIRAAAVLVVLDLELCLALQYEVMGEI